MGKPTDSRELRVEMGRRLVKLREWLGITQKEFAIAVGIDPQSHSKLERGRQAFSLPTIRSIAKTFDVSADWLMLAHENAPEPGLDPADARSKIAAAVDDYINSMPPERAIHPATADKLRRVPFESIVDGVPSWDDIHTIWTVLSRYEPHRDRPSARAVVRLLPPGSQV